jgi:hypothetical protein
VDVASVVNLPTNPEKSEVTPNQASLPCVVSAEKSFFRITKMQNAKSKQ